MKKYPFIFLVLLLTVGIFLSDYLFVPVWLIILLLGISFLSKKVKTQLLVLSTTLVSLGIHLGSNTRNRQLNTEILANVYEQPYTYGKIIEAHNANEKPYFLLELIKLKELKKLKIKAYLDSTVKVEVGDVVFFDKKIKAFKATTIPNEFNYKQYALSKRIIGQVYLTDANVLKLG